MFVGLLVDLPTATSKMADALDDAVPTMSDVIITWIAWGGTVFFGGLLVERIGRTVANLYMDIVNNRHRSETLRSLSGRIEGARAYIEESQNEQKDRTDKEVKLREAILLMELVVLSKDLRKLGVNSPSANRLELQPRGMGDTPSKARSPSQNMANSELLGVWCQNQRSDGGNGKSSSSGFCAKVCDPSIRELYRILPAGQLRHFSVVLPHRLG